MVARGTWQACNGRVQIPLRGKRGSPCGSARAPWRGGPAAGGASTQPAAGISCRLPFPEMTQMIQRIDAGPRMSEASIHNGVVYLAGQVPETDGADIETQTREVLA